MPCVTLGGLRHYFRLEGNPAAPPLVLVHAVGTDHSLWDAVVPALTDNWQVLRYDLRGHGGSQTPQEPCTIESLGHDLLQLADHVGWQRFALCGLSIGALTAMQVALTAPQRVTGLALTSTAARVAPPPGGWAARAQAALEGGMAPLAQPMVERMFSAPFRERAPALMHTMKSVFLQMDPRGYAACVAALEDADFSSRLGSIACPAVVIRGADDVLLAHAAAQALADAIRGGRLVEVEGAHFPPLEDPAGFVQALSSLRPGSR